METNDALGPSYDVEVVKVKSGMTGRETIAIATEIPFTIVANDQELATLMCTPGHLLELATGFLFTSGFIHHTNELHQFHLDEKSWRAEVRIARNPDPKLTQKRLYTAGCGKGVMYAGVVELAAKQPLESNLTVTVGQLRVLLHWLQHCSALYKSTGGIHTSALSVQGEVPDSHIDDIGRHNAVDKVIGTALADNVSFADTVLISSGRTSTEILHKAKIAGIPITLARGAPTHQTVLKAREMNITVIGFARSGGFTIFTHPERVTM
ncbi:MAG: formate dehydrogenase accessory sulfurtransferase FdhD [Chitinivibrionales bacterium]|nr:formate dehydrogenase accessory sulfurtransferase FdhD [Chitinivibrionales bacterium]